MTLPTRKLFAVPTAAVCLLGLFTALATVSSPLAEETPYTVEDGKVDKGTYNGYRRFHGVCHTCHGQDAMGSTIAPSLVNSMKSLSYEEFKTTVMEGRAATTATGAASEMPSFEENKDVMKYLDDIYSYLKARSDGALGPGRPERLPDS